jgi:site-specific DNA-methyltransferase (adenine-specific)
VLIPGGRLCIVVGDVCRSRRRFGKHEVIPLHADILVRCRALGFEGLATIFWHKIANATTEVGGPGAALGKPYEPNGVVKNDVEFILRLKKTGPYRKPTPIQRAASLLPPDEYDAAIHRNRVGYEISEEYWNATLTRFAALEFGRRIRFEREA